MAQPGTAQAWNYFPRKVPFSLFPSGYPGSNPGRGVLFKMKNNLLKKIKRFLNKKDIKDFGKKQEKIQTRTASYFGIVFLILAIISFVQKDVGTGVIWLCVGAIFYFFGNVSIKDNKK